MGNNINSDNKKILIIDDDEDIVNLFKIFLECNGYSVETFTDPFEALFNFRKNKYDLILLDLRIPRIDGITIYKKLKEIDENVIICMTTADHNCLKSLKKGIIDIDIIVLYKPIFLNDLKNKIDSLLVNDTLLKN
ncbi:MAG TPA: response regulator [Nitrososphaeraceae archaeon]|nr:response regulator [Nitrososphaeraceae archaeon]